MTCKLKNYKETFSSEADIPIADFLINKKGKDDRSDNRNCTAHVHSFFDNKNVNQTAKIKHLQTLLQIQTIIIFANISVFTSRKQLKVVR